MISKQLSPAKIEWFIHCPNAFLFLKRFDACRRYVDVNIENNCFQWKCRLNIRIRRYALQLLIFLMYVLFGTLGLLGLVNFTVIHTAYNLSWAVFSVLLSFVSILLAILLLRESNRIADVYSLVNKRNISDLEDY